MMGDIKTVETLKWSWHEAKRSFLSGMVLGIFILMLFELNKLLSRSSIFNIELIGGLTNLIVGGLICGLIGVLVGGFRGSGIQQKNKSNQGIFRSARNATIIGLLILFSAILIKKIDGISVPFWQFSIFLGQVGMLIYGGNACIRHFALRFSLYRQGYVPWDYAHFLDYATERLFLQKVGGGYIFVHRMLLEHFAESSLEQEKR